MAQRKDDFDRPKRPYYAALLLLGCMAVAFLSFISLDLALFCGIFVILGAFYDAEKTRIHELEQDLQRKFHNIEDRQKVLMRDVLRNTKDIRKMEQDILQSKASKGHVFGDHGKSFSDIIPAFLKPQTHRKDEDGTQERDEDALMEAPVVQKTATAERAAPLVDVPEVANDDLFLDDESLSDMVVRELVHHAVESSRIDVFMQPIVRLPQRQIKSYEMFARIRAKAGVYLPAKRYMALASEEQVMSTIDNMLLLNSLQALRKSRELNRDVSYFLNIKPETIRHMAFMRDLLSFLSQNREMASSLVFEMASEDFMMLSSGERKILSGLATLGCVFSLDHLEAIPEDVKFLQDHKIRFIKISAQSLLEASETDRDFNTVLRLKRKLEANGIGVIVEKIETESELLELLDYNINYGQGYLFGRPDLQGVYARKRRVS